MLKTLPDIKTIFDSREEGFHPFQGDFLRSLLQRLLPPDFFDDWAEGTELKNFLFHFEKTIPLLHSFEWGTNKISIYLVCKQRVNVAKFFYEMIHHWLLPGKKIYISSFFAVDFQFDEEPNTYTLCEVMIAADNCEELTLMRSRLSLLQPEIFLGLTSMYHAHPLFMPRNEEEVLRNVITLSHQLKFSNDIPQAIFSFDEQTEGEICFTVIWLRVLKPGDSSIEERFQQSGCLLKWNVERTRQVGWIRKKFPKEASVFQMKIPIASFLRADHSVDLLKARHFLAEELKNALGEFRDYNGGMIAKQHEHYLALKEGLPGMSRKEDLLLENFFHSIFPIEFRSVFPLAPLQQLFKMVLQAIEKKEMKLTKITEEGAFFLLAFCSSETKEKFLSFLQKDSSQVLFLDLSVFDELFLGAIYREPNIHQKTQWLRTIQTEITGNSSTCCSPRLPK